MNNRLLKILLIEDNHDFIFLLSSLLRQMGNCEVFMAYNGFEGLQKAKSTVPDIIFCDIGLPGMSGFDVARKLREDDSLKDIWIVALSGYAGEWDIANSAQSGFNLFLPKPVSAADIRRVLHKACGAAESSEEAVSRSTFS